MVSQLDPGQIIKRAFDDSADAIKVEIVAGSLVPESYDSIDLTYVATGNGAGEIETVTYNKNAAPIALLTLSYDSSNRLISVVRS